MANHGVIIVSGGAAITPYTSATEYAPGDYPAGSSSSALRAALLAAGHLVFTAPAMAGVGPVVDDPEYGGFANAPVVLPDELTLNSTGPIDAAGERLANFAEWVAAQHSLDRIDFVGHSMGGLFSRAAIAQLQRRTSAIATRTLVTLGSPWEGAFTADYTLGDRSLASALGDPTTEAAMKEFAELAANSSMGAAEQVSFGYLAGEGGWNDRQRGVLDAVAVTMIAGTYVRAGADDPGLWPHDGIVAEASALAMRTPDYVAPQRERHSFDDVHSIVVAERLGLPNERGLTWNPAVLAVVERAIAG